MWNDVNTGRYIVDDCFIIMTLLITKKKSQIISTRDHYNTDRMTQYSCLIKSNEKEKEKEKVEECTIF